MVELVDVERLPAVIHKSADTVFLRLALVVMVMMVVVMMMVVVVSLILVILVVVFFVVVVVLLLVVVMMVLLTVVVAAGLLIFVVGGQAFQPLHPSGLSFSLAVVKAVGVHQLVKVHLGIVGLDDASAGVQVMHYLAQPFQLGGCHFRPFVQQYDVAELYLLDNQILNVLFGDGRPKQPPATVEFALHAQGVDNGHDAVQPGYPEAGILVPHAGHGADSACYWFWLADTAGLNHNIVEFGHAHNLAQLFHQVHFQCAADAAILQGHKTVVALPHDAPFLDERSVDVHLSYIVHHHGKPYVLPVIEDVVEQRGLATAQITRQQQHWRRVQMCHVHHIVCVFVSNHVVPWEMVLGHCRPCPSPMHSIHNARTWILFSSKSSNFYIPSFMALVGRSRRRHGQPCR